jgi:putative SOS response-associated peptidase YedK
VNASPGTYRPLIKVDDGVLFVDDVHWGYRSTWAEASKKIPMAINTRLDKITNRYWKPLLKAGRAIVPANGWYEWTGDKGSKQPWHIHRIDKAPLYLAALFGRGAEDSTMANGFTIVTAAAESGLLDVHDRRPIVLNAADAAMWMKQGLEADEAVHMLNAFAAPAEQFAWHMVGKAIGNVRNQDAHLSEPINP